MARCALRTLWPLRRLARAARWSAWRPHVSFRRVHAPRPLPGARSLHLCRCAPPRSLWRSQSPAPACPPAHGQHARSVRSCCCSRLPAGLRGGLRADVCAAAPQQQGGSLEGGACSPDVHGADGGRADDLDDGGRGCGRRRHDWPGRLVWRLPRRHPRPLHPRRLPRHPVHPERCPGCAASPRPSLSRLA